MRQIMPKWYEIFKVVLFNGISHKLTYGGNQAAEGIIITFSFKNSVSVSHSIQEKSTTTNNKETWTQVPTKQRRLFYLRYYIMRLLFEATLTITKWPLLVTNDSQQCSYF